MVRFVLDQQDLWLIDIESEEKQALINLKQDFEFNKYGIGEKITKGQQLE